MSPVPGSATETKMSSIDPYQHIMVRSDYFCSHVQDKLQPFFKEGWQYWTIENAGFVTEILGKAREDLKA